MGNCTATIIWSIRIARKFQLGTNVLGRRVKKADTGVESEIIGVVKDVKRFDLAKPPYGGIYRSYKQLGWGQMTLVLRTPRDPAEVTRAVRGVLDQLVKDLPLGLAGLVLGLIGAFALTRALERLLYEIEPTDPLTFIVVPLFR